MNVWFDLCDKEADNSQPQIIITLWSCERRVECSVYLHKFKHLISINGGGDEFWGKKD